LNNPRILSQGHGEGAQDVQITVVSVITSQIQHQFEIPNCSTFPLSHHSKSVSKAMLVSGQVNPGIEKST